MKTLLILLAVLFTAFSGLTAQTAVYKPFISTFDSPVQELPVEDAAFMKVDNSVKDIIRSEKPYLLNLEIPLSETRSAKVILKRFEILTPDARLVSTGPNGDTEHQIQGLVTGYTGVVEGVKNSFVTISFTDDAVYGYLNTNNDNYILGRIKTSSGFSDTYILYQETKLKIANDFVCGTDDSNLGSEIENMMKKIQPSDQVTGPIRDANIAFDIDYIMHNSFGGVSQATAYTLALMNMSSALYLREMNVKLNIPFIHVWTTPDPFPGPNSNAVLTSFRNYWNANYSGVQRTVAHLLSTTSANQGGIAFINVLCSNTSSGFGYGYSNIDGFFNFLPVYSWDVMVVSHELGHNFGSPHTHNCGWVGGAIDSCYATEGGCYTGPVISRLGTIMSYCHLTSGGIALNFGTQPANLIRNTSLSAGCITNSSRVLEVAYPNGGENFRTFVNEKIYWGTSLTGNVNIEYSTNNGSTWSVVATGISAQLNEYTWLVPNLDTTLQAKIRIYNPSNPSEADTCNAVFKIHKNLTMAGMQLVSPPTFSKIYTTPTDTTKINFVWRKAGFHPSIRYKWSIKKIGSPTEYFYQSNNTGIDTSISIRESLLDSLARITFGYTGDSVLCTWRSWSYNGIDSSSSNTYVLTLSDGTVGIQQISQEIPAEFGLGNNYPNPFNPSTKIAFDIPHASDVKLTVFDNAGREVAVLVNMNVQAGKFSADFNASHLSSGIYFYRLEAKHSNGRYVETKRMALIK